MEVDINNLPQDRITLQRLVINIAKEASSISDRLDIIREQKAVLLLEKEELIKANSKLKETNRLLLSRLSILREKYYGSKSEKVKKEIKRVELQLEESEVLIREREWVEEDLKEKGRSKAKPSGRKKLPDNLVREEIIISPAGKCPQCGSESMRKISDDISEVLEYVPSSFKVLKYIRPRCACNECDTIVQGYAPTEGISKGKAGTGLLSHILVQKYCNHLPLYRQSVIYEREGIEVSRSTMASWTGQSARILTPLVEEIRKEVFRSKELHGDDTPVRVLAPGAGKTKVGRIWCYVKDGRNYGNANSPAVCYYYSADRKSIRPQEHLKDFKGVLHADAYGGYDKIYQNKDGSKTSVEEAACWAHARRKFYDITITSDNAEIANQVLKQISALYEIESNIRGKVAEERLYYRKLKSKGIVEELFTYMRRNLKKLPAKGLTAGAIKYALNNENALKTFLENGKVEIDNNPAERALRGVAIGRKNWLFAGSDSGGETAASIYTIIETAKLNGLNPWKYLRQILATLQDYPARKIADLLPWNIVLH